MSTAPKLILFVLFRTSIPDSQHLIRCQSTVFGDNFWSHFLGSLVHLSNCLVDCHVHFQRFSHVSLEIIVKKEEVGVGLSPHFAVNCLFNEFDVIDLDFVLCCLPIWVMESQKSFGVLLFCPLSISCDNNNVTLICYYINVVQTNFKRV